MDHQEHPQALVQTDDLVEDVSWQLAATASVARVAFIFDGQPQVVPVNIAVVGHMIVFRTADGSMLDALAERTPVAVEIDHVDDATRTGWSVIVRGRVENVGAHLLPVVGNAVHPWAEGDKDRWLWVRPEVITGRAISHGTPRPRPRLPYMALD